eukprot:TRINITY_DN4537_c0_g1_i1.p2 TRINITY_DN4537_c0_g1~~TRINITY_DN4537_c0_g1_i1.p2  ORF type:complete len:521 (+),score=108.41 TRINITY_DN4537_c0_g1_i1:466-2028(+)
MQRDPLRALLRGCSFPSKALAQSKPPLPASTQKSVDLDFFNNKHTQNASASPTLSASFNELVANDKLRTALANMHITSPTPVQQRVIPFFHTNDVLAVAPTGSGKTLCYLLPLVEALLQNQPLAQPHALILAPTRELAEQISRVLTRVLQLCHIKAHVRTLTTRASVAAWKAAPKAVHFIIATPRRLLVAAQNIRFSAPAYLVLDEADELFDEKFLPQLDEVLHVCGARAAEKPRLHLFSATIPPVVAELAASLMQDVKRVTVGASGFGGSFAVDEAVSHIHQRFVFVGGQGEQGKVMAVRNLIRDGIKPPVLVFVQTKERAADLFRELVFDGVHVDAIHADRTAAARASAVARFRTGKIWVLIATDVLARGLDFLAVQTVINYDMPSSSAAYVHRIGRTGRNGKSGNAVTLFTEEDKKLVAGVVRVARASGADLPEWLVKLGARVRRDEVRRLEKRPPKRKQVGGPNRASVKGAPATSKKRRKVAKQEVEAEVEAEAEAEADAEAEAGAEHNDFNSRDL